MRIQVEQFRLRLTAFAAWQAPWRSDGWRIQADRARGARTSTVRCLVDGQPLYLRGRIDRIDVHEADRPDGRFRLQERRLGRKRPTTRTAHDGEWVDLQLPLYRHLVKSLDIAGPVRLGYILLPKKTSRHQSSRLADLDRRRTAGGRRKSLRGDPRHSGQNLLAPGRRAGRVLRDLAAICQDDVFGAASLAAEAAEEADP